MPDPTPERWLRVREVFDVVADLPAAERDAALREACRTPAGEPDADLRTDVEALLDADWPTSFLDVPAADGAAALVVPPEAEAAGAQVGAWRVIREVGRGGMGAVYLVERADGAYKQQAALKRLALTGPDRTRRFERERQILAGLNHPGIARLIDGGMAEGGIRGETTPFLVMEYVEGVPITRYADAHELDTEARIQLFTQVCDAVGHAHRHLVVHRDLKPSNVLVAEGDGRPVVKLLDFGVAKLLEETSEDAGLTRTGLPLLTPEYAAPEQVTGETVTTATDVYALGVLLYELLAGQRPYDVGRGTLTGIIEAVRDREPPPASVTAVDDRRRRALHGDLDAILAKALEKPPARRYGSADDLANDLRRHLGGIPVRARPPTLRYRAQRFVRRHRVGVAAVTVVVLAVAGGVAATLWQARETRIAAAESETTATFLADLLGAADPLAAQRLDTLRVADLLDEGARRIHDDLDAQPRVQVRLLQVLGTTYRNAERWEESEPLLRKALDLQRELGADPAVLSTLMQDLAATQSARGEHAEAVGLAEEALRLAHVSGEPEALLGAERGLGSVLLRAPVDVHPDSLFVSARARAVALYGPWALEVAEIEEWLGEAALGTGRFDEAERHVRRAIEITERVAGMDHVRLVAEYQFLSFIHLARGEPAAAETTAAHAVAIARAADPASNRLGNALTAQGQALRRLGRLDEAEAVLRESIPLQFRRDEDRATPLGTLASVLEEQGRLDAAIATQGESYRLLQTGVALHRPVIVSSGLKLARLMSAARRYAAAEVILREVEGFRADLPSVSARTAAMLDRQIAEAFVSLYEAWGRPEDAARYQMGTDDAPGYGGTVSDHGTR